MRSTTLGLPPLALLALALVAVPRPVLHDLEIIQEGTAVNALFVAVPLLIWIVVVVLARVPKPFLTLLAVGAVHGVLLAVVHQVLWDADVHLAGSLPPAAEQVLIRGLAAISSVFTGLLTGAVTGLVAWPISVLAGRARD
ncbi:hypothetical protein [Catenuloplanes atrovinosus]|uniref:Uncharacterized protein n=1 Tax=Catenuloplanes atrovinosus TaxID=137266 RepID=A0AAE3YJR1_9ACTN|nr:hypothetical protein [Catenuloplanes atrovinosus]MDR7273639.1 hypothetical protein [Catenuloplanes atrovinosus]